MKIRMVRTFIVAAALVLAVSALASAQAATVTIKHNFLVGEKTYNAGTYTVDVAANENVVFTPEKGGAPIEFKPVKVLTTRKVKKVELAFDVVGSVKYLSEVWIPGKGGFQIAWVPYSEERTFVTGSEVK
jgi:hypothetical protein